MRRHLPIFYSALLLTLVNLLLRFAGTGFQVYLSGQIGPEGVGLLQLVLSVSSFALVAGNAGIRTAAMYLTAEELGERQEEQVTGVLSGCFRYSMVCSGAVAVVLYLLAPLLAEIWIGNSGTAGAIRLFAVFLPVICFSGVLCGYFTAANRIFTLAMVEVAEQLVSMGVTVSALLLWGKQDASKACLSVVLGSCMGACVTVICLLLLRLRDRASDSGGLPAAGRITDTAVPLGTADLLKSGINTAENLMVPKRLALHSATAVPLAAFGIVSGMVFPVLMFPACILYGLAELLIPELARCKAAGSNKRITYLVKQSLRVTALYGAVFCGLELLMAEELCRKLYQSAEAGQALRLYALLIPMLYCDAITDAMTKGLGQQKICVRYNILTSALDVLLLYLFLPEYGMKGYFVSFFLTHLLNFLLSIRRLLKISGVKISLSALVLCAAALMTAVILAQFMTAPLSRCLVFLAVLGSLFCLFGITGMADLRWLKGLVIKNDPT